MSGPTITVVLDASAVAGLLTTTDGLIDTAREHGLHEIVEQQTSMKLALVGALRAHGWTPCGNGQWEQRPTGRRR